MLNYIITTFLTILFIVNPLGSIPVLLALTEGEPVKVIRHIVRRAVFVIVFVLSLFAVAGQYILDFFRLSLGSISIAGGLILFLIALNMIQAERVKSKNRPEEEAEAMGRPDVSIVPLAIPMLAGPGSITTVLVLVSQSNNLLERGIIVASIFLAAIVTYIVLSRSQILLKILGRTGINVFTRLMGLILAALAVQFVLNGLARVLPPLIKSIESAG